MSVLPAVVFSLQLQFVLRGGLPFFFLSVALMEVNDASPAYEVSYSNACEPACHTVAQKICSSGGKPLSPALKHTTHRLTALATLWFP